MNDYKLLKKYQKRKKKKKNFSFFIDKIIIMIL